MLSNEIATLLKSSRKTMGLTQHAAASRADVSRRLWAEVERGERPNVSLETALRMLRAVGVAVQLTDPTGATSEIRPPSAAIGRAARAAARRAAWVGRQTRLGVDDDSAAAGLTPSARTKDRQDLERLTKARSGRRARKAT